MSREIEEGLFGAKVNVYPAMPEPVRQQWTDVAHDAFENLFRNAYVVAAWHEERQDDIEGFQTYAVAQLDYIEVTVATQHLRLTRQMVDRDVWTDIERMCADDLEAQS